jgi:hypothetical protein
VKRRTKQISAPVERRLRAEKKRLADEIRRRNLRAALHDFERRHGAITKEELSAARARVEKA